MSYSDRLRAFVYVAPSGLEFTLEFDSLSRTGGKKAPVTEFPGQNQGAVQDLGNVTPTFPVNCYISGADYDTTADSFYSACHEDGPGLLKHPRWGNINVLPIVNSQSEQFVDGARRAVFDLTFIKADDTQFDYPTATTDYASEVTSAVDDAGIQMEDAAPSEISDTKTLSGLTAFITDSLDTVTDAFDNISEITDDIKESIDEAVTDITNDIDALIGAPADLMTSLLALYRLPGTLVTDIQEKLTAYEAIYTNLIDGFESTTTQYGEDFGLINVANLAAISAASAEAAGYGDIPTRTQASEIVTSVDDFSKTIRSSIEDLESLGDFTAAYEMQLALENSITVILTGLIDTAINLPTERTMTLKREVTPIQLVFELYGDLEYLDFFIEFNNLSGDDILLMPRGTEVKYYYE